MDEKQIAWVLSEIDKEIDYLGEQILAGNGSDYADYRRGCGVIHGFRRAKEIILTAIKDAEKENE